MVTSLWVLTYLPNVGICIVSITLDFRSLMRIQNSIDPVTTEICWKLCQLDFPYP